METERKNRRKTGFNTPEGSTRVKNVEVVKVI